MCFKLKLKLCMLHALYLLIRLDLKQIIRGRLGILKITFGLGHLFSGIVLKIRHIFQNFQQAAGQLYE